MMDLVDNEPFRIEVLNQIKSSNATWSDMCRRINYLKNDGRADTTRLKRILGLKTSRNSNKKYSYNKRISYDNALLLCKALDLDPIDFGL